MPARVIIVVLVLVVTPTLMVLGWLFGRHVRSLTILQAEQHVWERNFDRARAAGATAAAAGAAADAAAAAAVAAPAPAHTAV